MKSKVSDATRNSDRPHDDEAAAHARQRDHFAAQAFIASVCHADVHQHAVGLPLAVQHEDAVVSDGLRHVYGLIFRRDGDVVAAAARQKPNKNIKTLENG